jgi:prostaglandin-H2 D-isomerase / glutathione transferase
VPVLKVDGTAYTQSDGILRYCGKVAGLYPRDDDLTALNIDEVLGVCADFGAAAFSYRGPDKQKAKEAREEFVGEKMPKLLGGLEKIVKAKSKSDTWLCGDSISVADLQLYYMMGNVKHGFLDHVPTDCVDAYPRLMASYNAVLDHPKVVDWNAEHPWKVAA